MMTTRWLQEDKPSLSLISGISLEDAQRTQSPLGEPRRRVSSVKRSGRKKHKATPRPRSADPDLINQNGHQHAIAYVEGDKNYGAKATMNVWAPKIQQLNEFSLSQIWILGVLLGRTLIALKLVGSSSVQIYMGITIQGY